MSVIQRASREGREPLVGGIVLVLIGVGLLAAQLVPDISRFVVALIGVSLLLVFLVTRTYGALVGGSIVSGVGVGVILVTSFEGELGAALMLLSLATGFIGIWALSHLFAMRERHWWPLVPGLIVGSVAVALALGGWAIDLLAYWPAILIVIGAVLLFGYWFRPAEGQSRL